MAQALMQQDEAQPWDYYGFSPMYARLVEYGLCYLRSGEGRHKRIIEWQDWARDRYIKRVWTGAEIEAAARLHSRIIRLPLRHNLVLQVFFNESCASYWPKLEPDKQDEIIADLTLWTGGPPGVNVRIHNANREWGWNVAPIRPEEFIPIRDRGIRMLCNGEKVLNGAREGAQVASNGQR
jgi:hypothetical protein